MIQQLALNERWPIRITVHAANGETTADGLGRMNGILQGKPDVIVLALGANDGLRSIAPEEIRRNLQQMGIPEEVEHGIRRKWNIDSGGSGTANPGSGTRNPEEVEHRFRRKWNSGSGGRERSSVA